MDPGFSAERVRIKFILYSPKEYHPRGVEGHAPPEKF